MEESKPAISEITQSSKLWEERVSRFISSSPSAMKFICLGVMGNERSSQQTLYHLADKFPELLWEYKGVAILAAIPKEEPLKSKALNKWKTGAIERRKNGCWPPYADDFEGVPYTESLEELADLYNYTVIGHLKNQISDDNYDKVIKEVNKLYNTIRKSYEEINVESI